MTLDDSGQRQNSGQRQQEAVQRSSLPPQTRIVSSHPSSAGLFVGLITLDFSYLADHAPTNNQKIVATDYTVAAGGPATNAAVAFKALGREAILLGSLGCHPLADLIRSDLQPYGVTITDLAPGHLAPPPVSSIVVTQSTGERAVVSINALKIQAEPAAIPPDCLRSVSVVLLDGHQMEVGQTIARQATAAGISVVIDGGSWKPGFETLLSLADYAICSANFRPPGCSTRAAVIKYLSDLGIPHIALTQGDQPIIYQSDRYSGTIEIPAVRAIDTLGAGDIFHGAFCHYILQAEFPEALQRASAIATHACQSFGTRRWLETLTLEDV